MAAAFLGIGYLYRVNFYQCPGPGISTDFYTIDKVLALSGEALSTHGRHFVGWQNIIIIFDFRIMHSKVNLMVHVHYLSIL